MKLQTIRKLDVQGTTITATTTTEGKPDICAKVKLTNMGAQNARNKADKQAENFMRIANIENKKDKKKQFFNKHKSNN